MLENQPDLVVTATRNVNRIAIIVVKMELRPKSTYIERSSQKYIKNHPHPVFTPCLLSILQLQAHLNGQHTGSLRGLAWFL